MVQKRCKMLITRFPNQGLTAPRNRLDVNSKFKRKHSKLVCDNRLTAHDVEPSLYCVHVLGSLNIDAFFQAKNKQLFYMKAVGLEIRWT